MKAFIYNGDVYIRAIPSKRLFQSSMVHEVVNRGDIFAVRCSDQQLTIIPGKSAVEHIELTATQLQPTKAPESLLSLREELKRKIESEAMRMQMEMSL